MITSEKKQKKGITLMNKNPLVEAEKQFEKFDEDCKNLTMDRLNQTPKEEVEPQTKLSQKEIDKSKQHYLKPERSINNNQKFNENFREKYDFQRQYVQFIAENKEIIGDTIELWTRPFGGVAAEFWKVPVNKPVWGPRYLAEQIKRKFYHRLIMQPTVSNADGMGQYYGTLAADTTIQRLDANPVSTSRSFFMGA